MKNTSLDHKIIFLYCKNSIIVGYVVVVIVAVVAVVVVAVVVVVIVVVVGNVLYI